VLLEEQLRSSKVAQATAALQASDAWFFSSKQAGHYPQGIIYEWGYPLVNQQFAIENGPVEIVDFPSLIAW
jgi:hypothetical protein